MAKTDKKLADLKQNVRQFHQKLVIQNPIEIQLLKSMSDLVDKKGSESQAPKTTGHRSFDVEDVKLSEEKTKDIDNFSQSFTPITLFQAATFRTMDNVDIVDGSNQIQDYWNAGRSFRLF